MQSPFGRITWTCFSAQAGVKYHNPAKQYFMEITA
jgi:hypothetical protein